MPRHIKTAVDIGRRALLGLRSAPKTNLPAVIPPTQQGSGPLERMIEKPRSRREVLRGALGTIGSKMMPRLPLEMLNKLMPEPTVQRQPLSVLTEGLWDDMKDLLWKGDQFLTDGEVTTKEFDTTYKGFMDWEKSKDLHYGKIDGMLGRLTPDEREYMITGQGMGNPKVGQGIQDKLEKGIITREEMDEVDKLVEDYGEYIMEVMY